MDKMIMPAKMIPSFNVFQALERGVGNNFLIKTWGGLGDQVCAEPVIRYAFNHFKHCEISLAATNPELFSHFKFKKVYHVPLEQPDYDKYMCFDTILPSTHLLWNFVSHCLTHCVDFSSICAFHLQIPNSEKEIYLEGIKPTTYFADHFIDNTNRYIFIHAGKHWPSKTFPKAWWDDVLNHIINDLDVSPVLIGANADDNRGTVDVNTEGCIDLRNRTSIKELIWYLQNARCLITNDSFPLHVAASGNAHIGFIASCKHPDYITHWRKGQFGWRMKNLGHDGAWNHIDHSPVQPDQKEVSVEFLPDGLMEKILPTTQEVIDYIKTTSLQSQACL